MEKLYGLSPEETVCPLAGTAKARQPVFASKLLDRGLVAALLVFFIFLIDGCTAAGVPASLQGLSLKPGTAAVTVTQQAPSQITAQWNSISGASFYQFLVDDTPYFRKPILTQIVNSTALGFDAFQTGLSPGVTYYVQVTPGGAHTTFRLDAQSWAESYLTRSYARAAWNSSGRAWLAEFSGIYWDAGKQAWQVDTSWPDALTNVAQDAYTTELAARGGVNLGAVTGDLALLDEMASFYVTYENRFTTLGAMRAETQYDTSLLTGAGPDSTKTLVWVLPSGTTTYIRECDVCNSQFYHPVSRLLRIISTLPDSERTPSMLAFAKWYAPVISQDHLMRLLWRNNGQFVTAIQAGEINDEALWLAAAAAEVLGANANDPVLVPLSASHISSLQQAIQIIVQCLQTFHRTLYPATQNFQAQTVGSVSYFNGEYALSPDYAYSGYTGQTFPSTANAAVQANASWDISHFYRVPVFLRALYDNRKATGTQFPSSTEIQLVSNQLLYRNFQGNFNLPLFNNFFDGSNGWYRVGYHGTNFGYPPAEYCYSNQPASSAYSTPCMTAGAVQGWGLLAFLSPDLTELERSLANLAWSNDAVQVSFRSRYYYYAGDYAAAGPNSQAQYPILLFFVLSNIPEKLQ